MVLALPSLSRNPLNIWSIGMSQPLKISVIIPTFQRPESLETCIRSIEHGTIKPYEIIVRSERAPLSAVRNAGAREASGDILTFIDDDVTVTPQWLESIRDSFMREGCDGVSGPAITKLELRRNRDIFRYRWIKKLYDLIFLDSRHLLPGHFTSWGAWTTGATEEGCDYEGSVQFLEACNMSFKAEAFFKAGGFDETYKGVGDWSETDLSFKIRANGGILYFSPHAKLYHNVSRGGAFGLRLKDSRNRLHNYFLFADRWLQRGWRLECYKLFMVSYYSIKVIEKCLKKQS